MMMMMMMMIIAVISCKGANTSNMLKHLSSQHGIKYQECHVFDHLRTSANVAAGQTSSTGTYVDDGNVDIKYPALAHCHLATATACTVFCCMFNLYMFMFTILCKHNFGEK